ncbi:MAG: hypothetical protein JW932_07755 [Deltaproteobacteria bacterium]|nr:hypothetical protein [Deltaproteobacteria bacterium]
MKKTLLMVIFFSLMIFLDRSAFCDPIDDLADQFTKGYEALKPPSDSSSVRTDYKFEQTALATFYTIRVLKLMYEQNQLVISKYDEMLQRYDKVIEQNEEIIKILTSLGKRNAEQ